MAGSCARICFVQLCAGDFAHHHQHHQGVPLLRVRVVIPAPDLELGVWGRAHLSMHDGGALSSSAMTWRCTRLFVC